MSEPTAPACVWAGRLLAGVAVVVSSGCAFDVGSRVDGPLTGGDASVRNEVCLTAIEGGPVTVSVDIATNTGADDLLVDGIDLIKPEGLDLEYASLREIDGNMIGAQTAFPPLNAPELSAEADGHAWPMEPGEELGIVVGLQPTDQLGTADAIRISYQTPDGDQYFAVTSTSIVVINDPPTTC